DEGRPNRGWQLLNHVLSVRHQLGPLLDQQVGRGTHFLGHIPRHTENFPSKITTPKGIPAMMRFLTGKFSGAGWLPVGNSLTIAPRSNTFSYSFLFSLG